jgi:hypothetical protein
MMVVTQAVGVVTVRLRGWLHATHEVDAVYRHPLIQAPVISAVVHVVIELRRVLTVIPQFFLLYSVLRFHFHLHATFHLASAPL